MNITDMTGAVNTTSVALAGKFLTKSKLLAMV
jgi:hypothetical protein